jgi:hypothetical protein
MRKVPSNNTKKHPAGSLLWMNVILNTQFLLYCWAITLQIWETTPFLFLCILSDLPQQNNGRDYAKGAPPILYVPTFPWKYFFPLKQERSKEIKRELFMQERFLYSCVLSPEV